jgi:hypothetical protein
MSNGLMFQAAYTWSRTIDNSTADFFTTSLTPRRPQDFQNLANDKSVSALSRTHRFSLAVVYDVPFFKNANWLMKNIVGNWTFSPIYVYESPEFATVLSNRDANLNFDSAPDRAIFNPGGVPGTGTDVTPLCTSALPAGQTCGVSTDSFDSDPFIVAYLANNPNAQFIRAGLGALANMGRNTLPTDATNNIDLSVYKKVNFTERMAISFGAQFNNVLNHPQFIPGSNPGQGLGVNDVNGFTTTAASYRNFLTPGNDAFNIKSLAFPSNARTISLVAKFTF